MTREEILAVSPEDKQGQEQINQIIAEFMGVHWHTWHTITPNDSYCKCECGEQHYYDNLPENPDYCHSLDLMHEVEMSLMAKNWHERYIRRLLHTSHYLFEGLLVFTTALEKAKAAAITILEMKK